jgi:hypothetical protein
LELKHGREPKDRRAEKKWRRFLAFAVGALGLLLEGLGVGAMVAFPDRMILALGLVCAGFSMLALSWLHFRHHPVQLWKWVRSILGAWP